MLDRLEELCSKMSSKRLYGSKILIQYAVDCLEQGKKRVRLLVGFCTNKRVSLCWSAED